MNNIKTIHTKRGSVIVNIDNVQIVQFTKECVTIWFTDSSSWEFFEDESIDVYEAFNVMYPR